MSESKTETEDENSDSNETIENSEIKEDIEQSAAEDNSAKCKTWQNYYQLSKGYP